MSPSLMDVIGIGLVGLIMLKTFRSPTGIIELVFIAGLAYMVIKVVVMFVGWGIDSPHINAAHVFSGISSVLTWFLLLIFLPWYRKFKKRKA